MLGESVTAAIVLAAAVLGYLAGRLAGKHACFQERIARREATARALGLETQIDAARRAAEAAREEADPRTAAALERVEANLTRRRR